MVGWTRRNNESRARYSRWRATQSKEALEEHDRLVEIENRKWDVGCFVVFLILFSLFVPYALWTVTR
jgi:hypothetical protein